MLTFGATAPFHALFGLSCDKTVTLLRAINRPCRHRQCGGKRSATGRRQTACKPGSVQPCDWDGHSSGTRLAARLARPTRATGRECPRGTECLPPAGRPYSVLLPVGFAVPPPLPGARGALAAPFHPCPREVAFLRGRFVFCGTFPGVAPAGRWPAPYSRGARTFLHRGCPRQRPSGRLAGRTCAFDSLASTAGAPVEGRPGHWTRQGDSGPLDPIPCAP